MPTPKEYQDAATNPKTTLAELEELAGRGYPFVNLEIAKHPKVSNELLERLLPEQLSTNFDNVITLAVLSHPKISRSLVNKVSELLLGSVALNSDAQGIIVKLCCNVEVSTEVIGRLLKLKVVNSELRQTIAYESTRKDVQNILAEIKTGNIKKNPSKPSKPKQTAPQQSRAVDLPSFPVRDGRLLGVWSWIDTSSSSMGFSSLSVSIEEIYIFANDGRFIRNTHSQASNDQVNGSGEWLSTNQFNSHSPEDRGTWKTEAGKLLLDWDDGMYSEFSYYIVHGGLQLQTKDGFNRIYSYG